MLLSVVTDNELLASQIVKTIFIVILSIGIIFNLIRFFKNKLRKKKIINTAGFLILSAVLLHVSRIYKEDRSLRHNSKYISGTTIGYCSQIALGAGVEFEYELGGKKYRNCNTYHPISKDSIIVPGGKYSVRVSNDYPGLGRMDFNRKADMHTQ